MKRHTVLAGSVVVLAIAVGLLPGPASAGQTPSLGEVAKKEAERRKTLPPAGKTYTNKDLPPSAQKPATGATPSADTAAPADPVAAATEQKPEDAKAQPQGDQKDETYWKGRMTAAREELRRAEMFAEALQSRTNALNRDYTGGAGNSAQRSQVIAERTEALNELNRVKEDIGRARKKVDDIEEEARKAGVPPGWLR
jgi:hypothetical protein